MTWVISFVKTLATKKLKLVMHIEGIKFEDWSSYIIIIIIIKYYFSTIFLVSLPVSVWIYQLYEHTDKGQSKE